MPTYDTTALENALQAKINALDSTATVSELINLLNTAQQFDTEIVYDSSGDLPTDSAFYGSILSTKSNSEYTNNFVYHNRAGSWSELQPLNNIGGAPYYIGVTAGGFVLTTPGTSPTTPPSVNGAIQIFPFASEASNNNVGDWNTTSGVTNHHSTSHDTVSQKGISSAAVPGSVNYTRIYSLIDGTLSSNLGSLAPPSGQRQDGAPGVSLTKGYFAGGGPGTNSSSQIDSFPFAASTPGATSSGSLGGNRREFAANQDAINDFTYFHGNNGGSNSNLQFPHASEGTASAVANLARLRANHSAVSSVDTGYQVGGTPGEVANGIEFDKFPFASLTPSSNVGSLLQLRIRMGGCSSANSGYLGYGTFQPNAVANTYEKFIFASEGNTTNVGTLSVTHNTVYSFPHGGVAY